VLALLAGLAPASAQGFGRSQVIGRDFQWKVRSTEHFDIHYYEGSAPRVEQAADILERAFARTRRELEIPTEPPPWAKPAAKKKGAWRRRPFFLYACPNDFAQSTLFDAGDGTGGITEPLKNRFMVYSDGTGRWLEEVITHEFVHIMQFHVLISGPWRTGAILKSVIYPLWMMEGMPGQITHEGDPSWEEMVIRDAATSEGLIPLTHLEHFGHLKPHQMTLAYKEGAAAVAFLAEQYGRRKVGRMLKLFAERFETSSVLMELIGLDARAFDRKFREYARTKYGRQVRREKRREPLDYGPRLTRPTPRIPQFNTVPLFSPDGRTLYFLSTRYGHPPVVYARDSGSGRARRLWGLSRTGVENIPMGNFANLSRVMDLSRDGSRLVFAGARNHRDGLYLLDTRTGRLERRELPGFQGAAQPAFSPDGRQVVFSGMKDSFTDIYLYELETGRVEQLTADPEDDQTPSFTPDGRGVVYSSETADGPGGQTRGRRLYRVDLAGRGLVRLEESGGEARDPVVSPDGRRVLFVRDDGRSSEVCELDLASGRAVQLTSSIGGAFTPSYAPDGAVAFAALRGGSVHIHKAARSALEESALPSQARPWSDAEKFFLPGMGSVGVSSAAVALTPERPYRFTAGTDIFLPLFFYSSAGGFFWASYWQGSDLLNIHRAAAAVQFHSAKSFAYRTDYHYNRYRTGLFLGASGAGAQGFYNPGRNLDYDESQHGQFAAAVYPFDRHHALIASLGSAVETARFQDKANDSSRQTRLASAAFARDAVRGRHLVALGGDRLRLGFTEAADVAGGTVRYHDAVFEAHQYLPTGGQTAAGLRFYGEQMLGRDRGSLVLGGVDGGVGGPGGLRGGVRGYKRFAAADSGDRLAGLNAQWRFPIFPDINYDLWFLFPNIYFKALFGSIFTDAGSAWSSEGQLRASRWRDVRHSVGAGLTLYSFILQEFPLVISMDYARRTTSRGDAFYVYLGPLF
jgi:hypothetical protein